MSKIKTKNHSPELKSYCKRSQEGVCPKCGTAWLRVDPKDSFVSCYDCAMKSGVGNQPHLPNYPAQQQREDERREALLELPEATVIKEIARRRTFSVVGKSGSYHFLDHADTGDFGPQSGHDVAAAVTWGDGWWAKVLIMV